MASIPFYLFTQQEVPVHVYTPQEYETFKDILFIGEQMRSIFKEEEIRCENHNENLKKKIETVQEWSEAYKKNNSYALCPQSAKETLECYQSAKETLENLINAPKLLTDKKLYKLAAAHYIYFPVQDMRQWWPCFDTSAERMDTGFFLEFDGEIPIFLWTCWGKLPLMKGVIEDSKVQLSVKKEIITIFNAVKFGYASKDLYTLNKLPIIDKELPRAMLAVSPILLTNDFCEKWTDMQRQYNQEFKIWLKYPKRTSTEPADRLARNKPTKPVTSLQHLATPKMARKSPQLPPAHEKPTIQPRPIPLSSIKSTWGPVSIG